MRRARSATSSSAAWPRRRATTFWEQSRFIAQDETLRDFVLNEPRGGVFRHVNLLVPPKDPRAQIGLDHHGARGHAADVGLELDLRCDRPARHRHRPDERAGDALVLEAPGGIVEVARDCRTARRSASRCATSLIRRPA